MSKNTQKETTMKYRVLVAIIVAISSCKDPEKTRSIFPVQTDSFQTFVVNSRKDTTIIGAKGTWIQIPKNCFIDHAGTEVTGNIVVTLKEFYRIADFINNRLSTNTVDGKILKSSGMILLEAKSGNTPLTVKDALPLTIMFPRIVDSDIANLFAGQLGKNGEMRWQLLEPIHYDTAVIIKETIKPTVGETYLEELYQEKFGEVLMQVQFVIGPDTVDLTDENRKEFESVLRRTPGYNYPAYEPLKDGELYLDFKKPEPFPFYIFATNKLGFLNCDIFIEEELLPFTVRLGNDKSDVFMILDSLNSVIYPDSAVIIRVNNSVSSASLFNVPQGKSVTIVAYRGDGNNRHMIGVQKTNTSRKEISIVQNEATLKEIEETIKRL